MKIRSQTEIQKNKLLVSFDYEFDEDGFSMYDKRHLLKGEITLDKKGTIIDWTLQETHTGVATNLDPYKTGEKSNENNL